jgi:hypothetical protein
MFSTDGEIDTTPKYIIENATETAKIAIRYGPTDDCRSSAKAEARASTASGLSGLDRKSWIPGNV